MYSDFVIVHRCSERPIPIMYESNIDTHMRTILLNQPSPRRDQIYSPAISISEYPMVTITINDRILDGTPRVKKWRTWRYRCPV